MYTNGLNLENNQYKKGSKNKASLNISGSFNKKLYVGFNLNIYDLNINKENIHVENNFDANSAIKLIDFRNYLVTSGIGVSLQAGLIYKLNNIELNLKKNINNSVNLVSDFLLEQASLRTSN